MRKIEKIKILSSRLPPKTAVKVHSLGRQIFMSGMKNDAVRRKFSPDGHSRNLWGINFRAPLFNSAGVFKDFSYYELAYRQGAGAYLVGTNTIEPRLGNITQGIAMPFVVYPKSHASSNSLGIPNRGIEKVLREIPGKKEGFPVGASLASESIEDLILGLRLCEDKEIDFIEINESCPSLEYAGQLTNRLEYIKKNFLRKRKRNLPVIVKFSNDLTSEQIPDVMDLLIVLGFDGVNLGNTSTNYESIRSGIHLSELQLYDYYTKNFGGGVSGRVLKESSLQLSTIAREYIKAIELPREFHVVRTGGIESASDIEESEKAGISLNEWFTGYFESYIRNKDSVYRKIFER